MSFVRNRWFTFVSSISILVGTVVLFFAFQTTSSDFRFVTTKWNSRALCANNKVLVESLSNGGWRIGSNACPEWDNANPAAIVKVDYPKWVWVGFGLIVLGSVMQSLSSYPGPRTEAALRAELRTLKALRKQAE